MATGTQGISSSRSGREAESTPNVKTTHLHKNVLEPLKKNENEDEIRKETFTEPSGLRRNRRLAARRHAPKRRQHLCTRHRRKGPGCARPCKGSQGSRSLQEEWFHEALGCRRSRSRRRHHIGLNKGRTTMSDWKMGRRRPLRDLQEKELRPRRIGSTPYLKNLKHRMQRCTAEL